jgi:hypothetical protein
VTDLEQRYRGPSRVYRLVALVLIAALALSGVGLVGWTVFFHSTPQVQSRLTAFAFPDDHTAVANLTIVRESQFTDASCRLRAIAEDHTVVGEVAVPVVDGPAEQSIRVEIRTERRATSVQSLGCTTPDQRRPR